MKNIYIYILYIYKMNEFFIDTYIHIYIYIVFLYMNAIIYIYAFTYLHI